MSLLQLLFPGLSVKLSNYVIPFLDNQEVPWKILDPKNKNSLINQIISLNRKFEINYQKMKNVSLDFANGPIHIHPSAMISEYVRIEGPCYIGRNAKIRHSAYLRGGSWICENSLVGHSSEIKNSILLPGSKAPHFNYIGDSILGFDVNIGAGVKLSNVRNDKREIMVTLKEGERVYSGLRKFGALVGDAAGLGCNVVTNPGTIIQSKVMIGPNETLSGWN